MAFRSTSCWKQLASRLRGTATYTSATQPKLKSWAPASAAEFGHPRGGEQQQRRSATKKQSMGAFFPIYVAVGMIVLQMTLGLYTAGHHIAYAPEVHLRKKRREMVVEVDEPDRVVEVDEPDRVVEEADKFIKKSWFRKIAHVQKFDNGLRGEKMGKDVLAEPPRAITLKDVGVA